MKLGRLILVASSVMAFASVAHAGGPSPTLFWIQQADPAAHATILPPGAATAFYRQIVRASWYGGGERLSARTSTGEIFRPMALTAAHRTLPLGTMLKVSSLSTGRTTVVRVNDRGPAASTGRSLDLSRGAAMQLGMINSGDMRVAIEVLK